jgi:NAD(P)-dependent dehydrogenase (short-subunit alcohol dehydrogenase family)
VSNEPNRPKTALVTGASRRIGAGIAKWLADHGTNVAVHHHDSDHEADAFCAELRKRGVSAIALKANLMDAGQAADLFSRAVDGLGPIELLVNNASVFEPDDAATFDENLWEKHFALHLKAPAILSAQMARQNLAEGLIVNLIDQRVWKPTPKYYSYTISKSALWMATRTMAQTFAPTLRVNGIGPGPTLPNERQSADDFQSQVDGLILKRGPQLEEFGETIGWLWRAKSVTGQMIALDGGQHLGWETPDVSNVKE